MTQIYLLDSSSFLHTTYVKQPKYKYEFGKLENIFAVMQHHIRTGRMPVHLFYLAAKTDSMRETEEVWRGLTVSERGS